MNRTTFIVDGFNLYHSVSQASRVLGRGGAGTKWLNLHTLCACVYLLQHVERGIRKPPVPGPADAIERTRDLETDELVAAVR